MSHAFTLWFSAVRRALIALVVVVLIFGAALPLALAQDGGEFEPRTVRDFVGREVTIEQQPQRVIGMSASINEMLLAIGVTPAGVTAGMDYPPVAATLPTFGSGYQPNLEALAELEPDLIIGNAQLNMQIMDQLEAIAPTFMMMTLVPSDIPANVRVLGQLTGHETEAEFLASAYDGFLEMAANAGSAGTGENEDGPSIVIIVGTLDVPNYGKSATYLGAMAATLGATNIADAREDAGPFPGYAQLSIEEILDADPDYILTITRGAPTPMVETMQDDPVWSALTAVQEGRAVELDNRLYVEAPGPRFVEAMTQLYDLFYGEAE